MGRRALMNLLGVAVFAMLVGGGLAIGFGLAWRNQVSADKAFLRGAIGTTATVTQITERSRTGAPLEVVVTYSVDGASESGPLNLTNAADGNYSLGSRVPVLVSPSRPQRPRETRSARGGDAQDDRGSFAFGVGALIVGLILLVIGLRLRRPRGTRPKQ